MGFCPYFRHAHLSSDNSSSLILHTLLSSTFLQKEKNTHTHTHTHTLTLSHTLSNEKSTFFFQTKFTIKDDKGFLFFVCFFYVTFSYGCPQGKLQVFAVFGSADFVVGEGAVDHHAAEK